MSTVEHNLEQYCQHLAAAAQAAAVQLQQVPTEVRNNWLTESARQLRDRSAEIMQANAEDIALAPEFGLTDAQGNRRQVLGNADAGLEFGQFLERVGV